MARRAEAHPWVFGIAAGVLTLVVLYAVTLGLDRALPQVPRVVAPLAAEAACAGMWLTVAWRFGWLASSGFTGVRQWRSRYLLWWLTPFVLLSWGALADRPAIRTAPGIAVAAALTLLVGLNEETLCRGLILRAFLPRGARHAVLAQALLFGLFHVSNLIGLNPVYVGFEVVVVILMGIFLGALRLRINAIWPTILVHAMIDFGAFVSHGYSLGTAPPTVSNMLGGVSVYAVLALVGILLVRPSKTNPRVRTVHLSPDGHYIWLKGTWQPAQYSPDRFYVWDGGGWRQVPTTPSPAL